MNLRVRGYALALSALFISLPALVFAQTSITFTLVPWPVDDGRGAPYYHRAEVAGVETDPQGNVYLCEPTRTPVLVFDRTGNYLRGWGHGELLEPHSVRIDPQGNIWIPDIRLHQVKVFSPTGTLLRTFGTRKKKGRDMATRFNGPTDVAFGPNGDIYITDGYGNSRVVHLAADGSYIGEWGTHGEDAGEFRLPHSVVVDPQGLVYVADRSNGRIQVFTPNGQFIRMWDTLDTPWGLDIHNGWLYVAHGYPFTISIYDLQGNLITHQGQKSKGRPVGSFAQPHMLAVDDQGYMYTAELRGHRVQKFRVTSSGNN